MAKPWKLVAESEEFKALSPDQQEAARKQYFEQVVLPRVPAGREGDARQQFYAASATVVPAPASESLQMVQSVPRASAGERLIGGLKNAGAGLVQLAGHALPAATDLRRFGDTTADKTLRASREMTNSLGGDADLARIAGEAAPSIALSLLGGAPSTMLRASLAGAGQGALAGALQPVESGEDGDYWGTKASQILVGGGVGGAGAGGLMSAGKGLPMLVQRGAEVLRRYGPQATPQQQEQIVAAMARQQGIDWPSLAQDARDRILQATRDATEGDVRRIADPVQLARLADAEAVGGIRLTAGDLARHRGQEGINQWSAERNLMKLPGGEALGTQVRNNSQRLYGAIEDLRRGVPAPSMARNEADLRVAESIRQAARPIDELSNDLYRIAAGSREAQMPVSTNRLFALLEPAVKDAGGAVNLGRSMPAKLLMLERNQNPNVLSRQAQERPFTVADAENLAQMGNAAWSAEPGVDRSTMAAAVRSIQQAADEAAGGRSPFVDGRAMVRAREQFVDSIPGYAAVLREGAIPDGFVQSQVLSARPSNLRVLVDALGADDPEALNVIRGQVLDYVLEKAGAGIKGMEGITQAGLNKALEQIGQDRLRILFSPQEVAQLSAVSRLSQLIEKQPPGHSVNNSNSGIVAGQALLSLLGNKVPGGAMIGRVAMPAINAQRAKAALSGPVLDVAPAPRNALAELLDMGVRRSANPLAALLSTDMAEQVDR